VKRPERCLVEAQVRSVPPLPYVREGRFGVRGYLRYSRAWKRRSETTRTAGIQAALYMAHRPDDSGFTGGLVLMA